MSFSGDFTLCESKKYRVYGRLTQGTDDHVLDHSVLFGVIPQKYMDAQLSHHDLTFAMGRGRQRDNVDLPANEMQSAEASSHKILD